MFITLLRMTIPDITLVGLKKFKFAPSAKPKFSENVFEMLNSSIDLDTSDVDILTINPGYNIDLGSIRWTEYNSAKKFYFESENLSLIIDGRKFKPGEEFQLDINAKGRILYPIVLTDGCYLKLRFLPLLH